eukprot:363624-Chlamydomonas_euryale.AAC.2
MRPRRQQLPCPLRQRRRWPSLARQLLRRPPHRLQPATMLPPPDMVLNHRAHARVVAPGIPGPPACALPRTMWRASLAARETASWSRV